MKLDLVFILLGYVCGSLLFAEIVARLAGKVDALQNSRDGNPGSANAFMQCGFLCGCLTLLGDIAKGFLPIFFYAQWGNGFYNLTPTNFLVLVAPVLGHAFPLFFGFRGGKCIATTFGCLLGLLPTFWQPLLIHALLFVFFSTLIKISPHFYRTIITYLSTCLALFLFGQPHAILLGYLSISAIVLLRFYLSKETRKKLEVKLLWTH